MTGIFAGESNDDIARRRGTSPRTVANQIASIFRKHGVGSRAELVARRQPAGAVHAGAPHALLTAREREIVVRAVMGHSNKLIAHEVGLAASTVAGHMAKAATKLGARSRVELIAVFLGREAPGGDEASSLTPLRHRAQR